MASERKSRFFKSEGRIWGDESLAEEGASVGGCCSVDYRQCRNTSRLPCNVQEVKQIAAEPSQGDHKMIHKRPRRIGVTALLLNIIQVKHSLFSRRKRRLQP